MAEAIDLNGAMGLLRKSRNLLAPLFEAITNSFEAISQKSFSTEEVPSIEINFYFSGIFAETRNFEFLEVIDNGLGFDEPSFMRYKTLLDKTKGFKNRGSGRIQFLHRFKKIEITSVFKIGEQKYKREFYSDESKFVSNSDYHPIEEDKIETGSRIILRKFSPASPKENLNDINIGQLKSEIKNKFLLKLYLEKKKGLVTPTITINFLKNNVIESTSTIEEKQIPTPSDEGMLEIPYMKIDGRITSEIQWIQTGRIERLQWAHWKLPDNELSENGIFLCSKDVAIQPVPFLKIKKNESIQGHRHLTAVYGDFLDKAESVNDAVDSFTIPTQKEIEKEATGNLFFEPESEYIFLDKIEQGVKNILPDIYSELKDIKAEQDKRIDYYAEIHGIPKEIATAANIDISDSDEKVVEKIFKKQAEENSKLNIKIQQLYESLIELSPNDMNYQEALGNKGAELLELIPQQNKNELTRYVIRREMVTKILELVLKNSLKYQNQPRSKGQKTDKEGLIHDLVFKRKSVENDGLNDLWILNEEFIHFSGHSDIPLNQIKLPDESFLFPQNRNEDDLLATFRIEKRKTNRPDIFLYPEEGKCILVEFKAHDINLSDHLNQLTKYCNLIANAAIQKIDGFYCYLIGEVVDIIDLPGEFVRTIYGDYVKPNQPIRSIKPGNEVTEIAHIYQEVVHLSNIAKRASIRNKSFAKKLGIRLEEIPLDGIEHHNAHMVDSAVAQEKHTSLRGNQQKEFDDSLDSNQKIAEEVPIGTS